MHNYMNIQLNFSFLHDFHFEQLDDRHILEVQSIKHMTKVMS